MEEDQSIARSGKRATDVATFYAKHEKLFRQLFLGRGLKEPALAGATKLPADARLPEDTFPAIILVGQGLRRQGIGELLRAAAAENCPEAIQDILTSLLDSIGVRTLDGVFPTPKNPRGSPVWDTTIKIYAEWVRKNQPPLKKEFLNPVAEEYYPDEWANKRDHKKLRDRVRGSVLRHLSKIATNSRRIA